MVQNVSSGGVIGLTDHPTEKLKDKNTNKKLKMITLKNSKPGEPLLLHDEPIFYKNKIVGRTTSGCFSFNFNKNLHFTLCLTSKKKKLKIKY